MRYSGGVTPKTRARLEAAAGFDDERDSAICQARLEGASLREIAAVVGMSEAGVRKILNKRKSPNQ